MSAVDTTAPVFKNIAATQVETAAPTTEVVITWNTYEFADGQVEYGPTESYGSSTTLDTHTSTGHKQYLPGLPPNTLYHYRVKSRDAAGNLGVSPDATFTTTAAPSTPTLSATPSTVLPGATTTAAWQNVLGVTTSDWIGLYKSGSADTAFTSWFYTGTCAQFTSTAKYVTGSCPLVMPATPGTYELRLFTNNGYTRLATSAPVTVTAPTTSGPTLTAPATATAGSSKTVAWQGVVSPTSGDWIGVYKSGAADTGFTKWFYTATCTFATGTAKASGSCSLTMPTTPGTYEFRLFKNGGYTRLATSNAVTIT